MHLRKFRLPPQVLPLLSLLVAAASLQGACSDTINIYNDYTLLPEGGAGGDDPGVDGSGGGGGYPGAPEANTTPAEHELNLFGVVGNRFWFGISEEQLARLNETAGGGIGPFFDYGDPYTPGGTSANYVDHLWITSAGVSGQTADYGKVEVKLVGQSTRRPWNVRSIPNLNIDSNEFVEGQRIAGYEHLRLNNAQVGSIFRERITLELYRKLGYPAPLVTYAWASSNVWGEEVSVPYVLVERYKRPFCEREKEALGGGCRNMWEFVGDFVQGDPEGPLPLDEALPGLPGLGGSLFDDPRNCQLKSCDNERVKELEALLLQTPEGEGFKAATSDFIAWDSFHRFQCLSWVLATGDDALHNQNNVVLVERSDGKFQYLPYSVDISLGQDWYPVVPLAGHNVLARGCQSDEACWDDTIAECESVISNFEALDPVAFLDEVYEELDREGMLRGGDDARYQILKSWFEARLEALPEELEDNREAPQICDFGQVDCGGYCDYPEFCGGHCIPPVGKSGGPAPREDGMGGAGGGEECPPITLYDFGG